jgi:hypothetical protein
MGDSDDDEEVAAAEIMWGKEPLTMNQRWIKQTKGTYDFDVTKADKLFEFLVKEGRIKLPEGHFMLRPDGVKEKRYCDFHDCRDAHNGLGGQTMPSCEHRRENVSSKAAHQPKLANQGAAAWACRHGCGSPGMAAWWRWPKPAC